MIWKLKQPLVLDSFVDYFTLYSSWGDMKKNNQPEIYIPNGPYTKGNPKRNLLKEKLVYKARVWVNQT